MMMMMIGLNPGPRARTTHNKLIIIIKGQSLRRSCLQPAMTTRVVLLSLKNVKIALWKTKSRFFLLPRI